LTGDDQEDINILINGSITKNNIADILNELDNFWVYDKQSITIDFSNCNFISDELSTTLSVLIYFLQCNNNTVKLDGFKPQVEKIFRKNGFLTKLCDRDLIRDVWETTIPFEIFHSNEEERFYTYITEKLISKEEFPKIGEKLKDKITQSLLEIYVNATLHSDSNGPYFTCGQVFPNLESILFSFVDTGIGIERKIIKVVEKFKTKKFQINNNIIQGILNIKDTKSAIDWALQKGSTTKFTNDGSTGGFGLYDLQQFVRINKGEFQIITNKGVYDECYDLNSKAMAASFKNLNFNFSGTAVNFKLNINKGG